MDGANDGWNFLDRMRSMNLPDAFVYEQCPFEDSIWSSYAGLQEPREIWMPATDPIVPSLVRKFGAYIQVLRGDSENLQRALDLEPMSTEDDAAWFIYSFEDASGFTATSEYCVTYGPFLCQEGLNSWLRAYGLELRNEGTHVRGESHFDSLESGPFHDALLRLRWLESFCVSINNRVEGICCDKWDSLHDQCAVDEAQMLLDEELLDPPPVVEQMGRKSRFRS